MAGHFFTTIENNVTGKPVNGATMLVYVAGATVVDNAVTGGTLATIYSDDGITTVDQDTLPLTSDSYGFVEFWTDETTVVIEISYDGEAKKTVTDVEILGGTVSSDVTALAARVDKHDTLLGTSASALDLGTFTGSTIGDNESVKEALQDLETAVESGVAPGAVTSSGLTMATARILGRTTASTGAIEELTAAQVQSFLLLEEWAPNFNASADVYLPADVAMTIDQGNAQIGTGTLAFSKSTNAAPGTFNSTTLPATLEAGAWLKISATGVTGFVATHLKRTA